jgi:hypothetical protein
MISPEWIEAAADLAAAVEKGVAMRNRKPVEIPTAPAGPTVVVDGISKEDFIKAAMILAAAVLGLAAAMLASALIVHHGLALAAA